MDNISKHTPPIQHEAAALIEQQAARIAELEAIHSAIIAEAAGDDHSAVDGYLNGSDNSEVAKLKATVAYMAGALGRELAASSADEGKVDEAVARAEAAEAEVKRLREVLNGIDIYLSDTLSGRVVPDPATYKDWRIEGIREARNRARHASRVLSTQEPRHD